jgi:hypothetical protein
LLYIAGGWSALLYVLLVLVPFAAPVPPTQGIALMEHIADHKVIFLTELVCFVGLAVPALVVFGAVAVALKGANRSIAAIGGLLGIASEVIAVALGSSPQSLHGGLVVLSNAYQDAVDGDRPGLVSAADALIAATNAVSWAGILTAAAILLLSTAMRGTSFFGPVVGNLGIIAGAAGIVAEARGAPKEGHDVRDVGLVRGRLGTLCHHVAHHTGRLRRR